jgi:hypothetical protein
MECANASMNIGGRIKRTDIQKLIDAILDDGAGFDWIDHSLSDEDILQEIERVAKSKTHLTINANEQPWGRFEQVEGVCQDLGLTYLAEYEAGGEWSPGCVFWQPELGLRKQKFPTGVLIDHKPQFEERDVPATREWDIAEIGRGPMLDATDIQKHLDADTLANELALMVAVHKSPWKIEIIEDGGSHGTRATAALGGET